MTPRRIIITGIGLVQAGVLTLVVFGAAAPAWVAVAVAVAGGAVVALAARLGRREGETEAALRLENNRLEIRCDVLRDSEARYREYSEAMADWFWETDSEHRFSWFSAQFDQILGLSSERLLGKQSWNVVSERMEINSEQWQAHIADLTALRPFRDFKYWLEDDLGRARWIKVSGIPRFAPDGSFDGYGGTGTDITAAVESAHRMNMLNRAVEQSPVSIFITDLAGAIEYVNSEFLRVTGYAADEVLGRNIRILKSDRTPPETYVALWGALSAGEKWDGELINRRKNGEIYWGLASILPIQNRDGEFTNYLAIEVDVTERKRNEARLAELVEELRRSNEDLEQFAYVASHDLRQPLRMISGYVALLQRHLADHLNDDTRTFFGLAIDGAKRLDRMIVDLLEYSRISRLSAPLEPIDLNGVLADSLHHLQIAIAEAGAEVTVAEGLPAVAGDRMELVRLFQNLIGNAIKYAAPDRPPRVEVGWRVTGHDWVLSVKDNGIGIPKDDLQRVFGIFQRLVTREQYEGTGIGLAVCRKIAEHHGGRIWVQSEVDVGSTFLVSFPRHDD